MEVVIAAIILFVLVISAMLYYYFIVSAIDGTAMADNIREIRDLLYKINQDREKEKKQEKDVVSKLSDIEIEEVCPACNSKVSPEDKECPECGLRLM